MLFSLERGSYRRKLATFAIASAFGLGAQKVAEVAWHGAENVDLPSVSPNNAIAAFIIGYAVRNVKFADLFKKGLETLGKPTRKHVEKGINRVSIDSVRRGHAKAKEELRKHHNRELYKKRSREYVTQLEFRERLEDDLREKLLPLRINVSTGNEQLAQVAANTVVEWLLAYYGLAKTEVDEDQLMKSLMPLSRVNEFI